MQAEKTRAMLADYLQWRAAKHRHELKQQLAMTNRYLPAESWPRVYNAVATNAVAADKLGVVAGRELDFERP